jgi:hypothetical protein
MADDGRPNAELLYDLLADLDRDPDGYVTKAGIAALIRSTWPDAPPGPDDGALCDCGCGRADDDCVIDAPLDEVTAGA